MTPREIDLNQSRVQFFQDCKRKYYWIFEANLVPDRPQWALEDGKAVHVGLAMLAQGKPITEVVKAAVQSLRDSMPPVKMVYDEMELREHEDLVARMLNAYVLNYGTKLPYAPLGIEVEGRVEIGTGTGVFLKFRTDQIVTWMNRLWIVDHKTAAKLDMRDLMKYEMDLQFTAYTYAVSKQMNQRVAGVIVDMLVKTKTPQFHQQAYVRTDEELAEFEAEFVEMAQDIQNRRQRVAEGADPKVVFYKNTKECFRFGTCPYRDLCLEDTSTRRAVFVRRKADYVDGTGNAQSPPPRATA